MSYGWIYSKKYKQEIQHFSRFRRPASPFNLVLIQAMGFVRRTSKHNTCNHRNSISNTTKRPAEKVLYTQFCIIKVDFFCGPVFAMYQPSSSPLSERTLGHLLSAATTETVSATPPKGPQLDIHIPPSPKNSSWLHFKHHILGFV